MLQVVDGKPVYVVDFDTMPRLPIVGTGIEQYYAQALTQAIVNRQIVKPGKYGISVDFQTMQYQAFAIVE